MYSSQDGFDPIGIIVDWFDTCRERRVAALIDLYDDGAIVDCCQGGPSAGGYRAYDGTPVRAHFTFTKAGKIRHPACAAIKQAA